MTQMLDQMPVAAPAEVDLTSCVQRVLQQSTEPLTISKIRAALPASLRGTGLEGLTEVLNRQVAANVLYAFPKYRSQQDRFWDRPMPVHVAEMLRSALDSEALGLTDLKRKLPAYAQVHAEAILREQISQGRVYRHPRAGRGAERFGLKPADPRDYLRSELQTMIDHLSELGFSVEQLRAGALELLHEQEWAVTPKPAPKVENEPALASVQTETPAFAPTGEQ